VSDLMIGVMYIRARYINDSMSFEDLSK